MPIRVQCPQCRAEFQVNEKFAGKKGPCPKCKNTIEIPRGESVATPAPAAKTATSTPAASKAAAATKSAAPSKAAPSDKPSPASKSAPAAKAAPVAPPAKPAPVKEKVVIHEPDMGSIKAGSADAKTPQRHIRPIAREEVRLTRVQWILLGAAIIAPMALAYGLGGMFRENMLLRGVGLWLMAFPAAIGGYAVLRDDELEPYRGRSLWVRTLFCTLVYFGLWVVYWYLPLDIKLSAMNWLFLGPPIFLVGAAVPTVCYDLDYGSSLGHYGFYLVVCLTLGHLAGIEGPWIGVKL